MLGFAALGELALGGSPYPTANQLVADVGSFTLTGQDVGLRATRIEAVGVGVFVFTGKDVDSIFGKIRMIGRAVRAGNIRGRAFWG